jgi:CBS domain-containing protein
MTTELQTVSPRERLDLAGLLMEQRRIHELVVVDDDGRLLGLLSYRALLRLLASRHEGLGEIGRVEEYMLRDPLTVAPDTPLRDAIPIMLEHDVSALAVIDEDRVVGVLDERDVARVVGELLEADGQAAG